MIILDNGFCNAEATSSSEYGVFQWLDTPSNSTASLPCVYGPSHASATRECVSRNNWTTSNYNACATIVSRRFASFNNTLQNVVITCMK